jgi:hypothetical protein
MEIMALKGGRGDECARGFRANKRWKGWHSGAGQDTSVQEASELTSDGG